MIFFFFFFHYGNYRIRIFVVPSDEIKVWEGLIISFFKRWKLDLRSAGLIRLWKDVKLAFGWLDNEKAKFLAEIAFHQTDRRKGGEREVESTHES